MPVRQVLSTTNQLLLAVFGFCTPLKKAKIISVKDVSLHTRRKM